MAYYSEMPMTRREFLAAAAAAPLASSAMAAARQDPSLGSARTGPQTLNLGQTPDRDGFVYVPSGYNAAKAAPLLVMLHGAGNPAQSTAYAFPPAEPLGL